MIKIKATDPIYYCLYNIDDKKLIAINKVEKNATLITNAKCEQYSVESTKEEQSNIKDELIIVNNIEEFDKIIQEKKLIITEDYTNSLLLFS